jgi:hypothetical protein
MKSFKAILLTALLFSTLSHANACSMYKITVDGKTMVGTNEDAWRTTSSIWFETGAKGEYGACYTGSRRIGENVFAAQSGMNEHGLVYSRLASYHPFDPNKTKTNRKTIQRPDDFLKQILHICKDVDEVYAYLEQYDHSIFIDDIFIFVEPSGRYLIVEPYTMQIGNEANYVLSNFCPSITQEEQRRNLDRYRKGKDFLSKGAEISLDYCTSLSDTMHVCREKIGDGTLLTGIWDTKNRIVHLYFYHDYSNAISFNIDEEIAKGNSSFDVTKLFPHNPEFDKLKTYITPLNTPLLRILLTLLVVFFFVTAFMFAWNAITQKKRPNRLFKGLFSILSLTLFYYMYVLVTNMDIFYFAAPYQHFMSNLISASSYIPFILLAAIIPSIIMNYKILQDQLWGAFWKLLLTATNLAYVSLVVGFIYWGFYDIF